ncbi:MAG: RDD family protein [Acidimicrobiales bacterium]
MADEEAGGSAGGPPTFPGGSGDAEGAPPPAPPASSTAPAPPSYPDTETRGFDPPRAAYPPPSFAGPPPVVYASWGLRVGGYLIDFVILALVEGVLDLLLRGTKSGAIHFTTTNHGVVHHHHYSIVALSLGVVISIVYATVLIGRPAGQTVGMMAVGVRCVRDESLELVGYGKAFVRSLVEEVFRLTVIVWIVDMLFPLWDAKRQTLHDKIVRTVVLRTK